MATNITDLPLAPSEWQVTPELRWIHRRDRLDKTEWIAVKLQQKWEKVICYDLGDSYPLIGPTLRKPSGQFEWRDVPDMGEVKE